jgi:glycosidase
MLSSMLSALPLLAILAGSASALDASSMRARSVYQVVTDRFALSNDSTTTACSTSARQYCGGTWKGIQSKLDYIQGMGFDTVWISPVVSNIGGTTGEGQSYHGYWSLDVSQLNSNFGAEADLKSLISALHSRGMYIMVDVVINHVAATSNSDFQTSSSYGPFSVQDDFHPFCWITDYSNQTNVEQCWLGDTNVALPDLNTESTTVVNYWTNWISQLVSNYTIDAIRIDTAKHIRADFWPGFTAAANVFNVAEILDGDPAYVGPYQKNATLNPFNYPAYYPIIRAFNQTGTSFTELSTMVSSIKSDFSDPTLLGGFTNNADNPRFENYTSDSGVSGARTWASYPSSFHALRYVVYSAYASSALLCTLLSLLCLLLPGHSASVPLLLQTRQNVCPRTRLRLAARPRLAACPRLAARIRLAARVCLAARNLADARIQLIMNAHAYSIVTDGIPYVYYGSEAGFKGGNDPDNREALWLSGYNTSSTMYGFFKRLNAARQAAGNSSSSFYTTQVSGAS